MSDYYYLEGHNVVQAKDVIEWAKKFEILNRKVAMTEIGHLVVSTVFLGLDHNYVGGPPLLFETMVYDNLQNEWLPDQERYSTWEEAEKGHEAMVQKYQELSVGNQNEV